MGWFGLWSKTSKSTVLLTQPNIKQAQPHKTYKLLSQLILLNTSPTARSPSRGLSCILLFSNALTNDLQSNIYSQLLSFCLLVSSINVPFFIFVCCDFVSNEKPAWRGDLFSISIQLMTGLPKRTGWIIQPLVGLESEMSMFEGACRV